jgi:hypothetical protein
MRPVKDKMDTFCASLLFCILVPLFPLFVSMLFHKLHYSDLLLTAALYPASLFIQSTSKGLFAAGIAILAFYSVCLSNREENHQVFIYASITIALVSLIHVVERYRLHVIKGKKFFQFNE